MSDEKREPKAPKSAAKKEEHPAPVPVKSEKPHKLKISHMSLQDIEHALDEAQKKMGGFDSHYAQFLLARRDFLRQQQVGLRKKAA